MIFRYNGQHNCIIRQGRLFAIAVIVFFPLLSSQYAPAVTVNHSDISIVSSLPQGCMDAVGLQRWFFSHASVGSNMVEGMSTLNAADPSFYQLTTEWVDVAGTEGGSDYRPSDVSPTVDGKIYEVSRGNPEWTNKVVFFENAFRMSNWANNGIQYAMNKFCWIDPYADAVAYLNSMAGLESSFPWIVFIYTTMPLTGLYDSDNNLRNAFNNSIRTHCATNNHPLLDVADIEAWSPDGIQQTYLYGGNTYQMMYAGYAEGPEDWHLNAEARSRMAYGWYALAASEAGCFTTWDGSAWSNGTPDKEKVAIISGNYSVALENRFDCGLLVITSPILDVSGAGNVIVW